MKKIFSNILLVFTYPIKLIKKSRIDNFVGGLLIGALFSLLVNVITNQFQEVIQKQRTLEAIENEIVSNMVIANTLWQSNDEQDSRKEAIIYYKTSLKYSSDTWFQSSEPLQYVAQLDPEVQIAIHGYYFTTISVANSWVEKANKTIDKTVDACYDKYSNLRKGNSEECLVLSSMSRGIESLAAETISKESYKLLQIFHPTKDRINSRLLRLFMGNKSMKILSN